MNAQALIAALKTRFPSAMLGSHAWRGDATVTLRRESLLEAARFTRDEPDLQMNFLMDVTAVDWSTFGKGTERAFFASSGVKVRPSAQIPDEDPWPGPPVGSRYSVVYHLFSLVKKHRLRLVVPLDAADREVDSLCGLWHAANWLEREAFDMFGIVFRGHPDLRRILMYDGFEGHPLRKDYPVNKRQPLTGPLN